MVQMLLFRISIPTGELAKTEVVIFYMLPSCLPHFLRFVPPVAKNTSTYANSFPTLLANKVSCLANVEEEVLMFWLATAISIAAVIMSECIPSMCPSLITHLLGFLRIIVKNPSDSSRYFPIF